MIPLFLGKSPLLLDVQLRGGKVQILDPWVNVHKYVFRKAQKKLIHFSAVEIVDGHRFFETRVKLMTLELTAEGVTKVRKITTTKAELKAVGEARKARKESRNAEFAAAKRARAPAVEESVEAAEEPREKKAKIA